MEAFINKIKDIIVELQNFSYEVDLYLQNNPRYTRRFFTYKLDLELSIDYAIYMHNFTRGYTNTRLCRLLESAYLYNYEYIQNLNVSENKKVSLKNEYQGATQQPGRDILQLIRLICGNKPALRQRYYPDAQEFRYFNQ
jgi:hypothetical protein